MKSLRFFIAGLSIRSTYIPMLLISPRASVILTLYQATGTAVRFSGISKFPKKILKFNIYFLL